MFDKPLTAVQAEQYGWSISWIGSSAKNSGEESNWLGSSNGGSQIDVDTTQSSFDGTPAYVTSMSAFGGYDQLWQVTGSSNIYSPSATGFRLYLHQANHKQVTKYGWRANYLGVSYAQQLRHYLVYADGQCPTTPWSSWVACSGCQGMAASGSQFRTRTVIHLKVSTWLYSRNQFPHILRTRSYSGIVVQDTSKS